ncbi:MAG TPA: hypothetical protein VL307_02855 [Chitinophagaceae bacterium]|nr:hypothetical protein [Chitinophagaceae bacterium]
MKFAFFLAILLIGNCAIAQSDTTLLYYSNNGAVTVKDSAFAVVKFYKQNGVWHGKDYYMKTNILKSEGDYASNNLDTPLGVFNNYNEAGKLDFTASYDNGKLLERTYYYKSGKKKSWISVDENGPKEQKGWDEDGKEIKNYIVFKAAQFKGGPEAWAKYLAKKTNAAVAIDAGAPAGLYKVVVAFKVSRDGTLSNVKATIIPAQCRACANEAIRVIMESDQWKPSIFQNEPAEFFAKQPFTFVVEEPSKKNRK